MAVADDDLVSGRVYKPCGFAHYTAAATALNLDADPANGKQLSECSTKPIRALIQTVAQDLRWTDDPDEDPTAAIGMLLKVNTTLEYDGDLSKFRFIEVAASAVVTVSYYGV